MAMDSKSSDFYPVPPSYVHLPKNEKQQKKMSFFSLQQRIIRKPQCTRLLRYKGSDGWFTKHITPKRCLRAMPFITPEGFISSNTVYYTRCTSSMWFSSVVSTVYDRITSRRKRWSRGTKRARRNDDLCLKTAILYVLTLDGSFLTRSVECQKRNDKAAGKMIYAKSRNVDAQTRFWYDQAVKAASWLKRRGGNPRDKSTNGEEYRIMDVNLGRQPYGDAQRMIDALAGPWTQRELVSNKDFRLYSLNSREPPKAPLNAKLSRKFGVKASSRLSTRRGGRRS